MNSLYLWDIDGTMVDLTAAHVKAYKQAYRKITGTEIEEDILVKQFGKVEKQIHQAIFRIYQIPDIRKIDDVIAGYTDALTHSFETAAITMLPGVKDFLNYLQKQEEPLGVVTGNSQIIGETILKRMNLYDKFAVHSYGGVSRRAHIVDNAIKAARQKGLKFERVIVLGDSPFDVHAGKENNALTVAVATGRYSLEELSKERPDILVPSLENYQLIVRELSKISLSRRT